MRILSVQFSNLNSLQGKHSISFVDGPLAGEGLFAITGPTGSGKSTILDAITLALYGRAARYRSRPSPPDMITRGCGEASSEVIFQVEGTKKYRASWYMYRARKKADGAPQQPKRFIYDENEVELASKSRDCDDLIVSLTGLTPDRFFRSAMLAQGEFARFLQADERERADLLESLTSTEIYSELGIAAFRKYSDAKEALNSRRAALESVQLMTEEEKLDKLNHKESLSLELVRIRTQLEAHDSKLRTLERSQQIQNECRVLAQALADLEIQKLAFAAESARLQKHHAALPFRNDLNVVELSEDQYRDRSIASANASANCNQVRLELGRCYSQAQAWTQGRLVALEAQLKRMESEREKLEAQQQSLEFWIQTHQHYDELSSRINEFRRASTQLTLARQSLDFVNESISRTKSELATKQGRSVSAQQEIQRCRVAIDEKIATDQSLKQKVAELFAGEPESSIEVLIQTIEATIDRLQRLLGLEQDATEVDASIMRLNAELYRYQSRANELQRNAQGIASQVQMVEDLIETLSKHHVQAERIKSFEEHRHSLEDGESCPLCGSHEHPYLEGLDIHADISETALKLEQSKRDHQTYLQSQRVNYEALADNEASLKNCQMQLETLQIRSRELVEEISNLSGDSPRLSMASISHSLGIEHQRFERLQSKRTEIQSIQQQQNEAEIERGLLQSKLDIIVSQFEETNLEIESAHEALGRQEQQYGQEQALYGGLLDDFGQTVSPWLKVNKDEPIEGIIDHLDQLVHEFRYHCDERTKAVAEIQNSHACGLQSKSEQEKLLALKDYASRLLELAGFGANIDTEAEKQAYTNTAEAFSQLIDIESRWKDAKATEAACQSAADSAESQMALANQSLRARIVGTQFVDRDALKQAFLKDEDLLSIQSRSDFLDQEFSRLESVLANRKSELEGFAVSLESLSEQIASLKSLVDSMKQELDRTSRELGMIQQQLAQDVANRSSVEAGYEQLLESERALEISRILSDLIGSADGKKFRAFTQGLMLGYLIKKANRHLSRFNDRYILVRGASSDLELEICDRHQANVTRPLASLSGGESFLVSLALALGLSDLSGSKVEIDTLFIDEGFGTLDSDSLDVAISALEILRGENKMIGIISHVESLKERISTQIRVAKLANGRSKITVGTNLK